MKSILTFFALASLAASAGCTIVTPASPDGSMPKVKLVPFPVVIRPDALPPPKALEASVLYVANLQRSSANLAGQYASIITELGAYLQSVGLDVVNMGLISTYGDQFGPRLLLGQQAGAPPSPSSLALLGLLASEADAGITDYQTLLPLLGPTLGNIDPSNLQPALQLLASSGNFDGDGQTSEAANLIGFGQGINAFALPPELGGIDRNAFFDTPHDLFIVVYLQPLPRRCALSSNDCSINGQSLPNVFLSTDSNANATWLSFASAGIPPSRVVQVSIATSEGQSETDFETHCKAVPGFPLNDLDVIGPSPNAYFTPLMAALNAANPGTGQSGDFCTLIGSKPDAAIKALGNSVAALASSN
ncbi:MAG TPA: hypothetical protein VH853_13025 [Polyangia bacterium]|jgi:hypothetical protein|nr:hypothetical protein [Polyangia bacterium]